MRVDKNAVIAGLAPITIPAAPDATSAASVVPAPAAAAARQHPGVRYLVTAPFGLHPLMAEVMRQRIEHCLAHTEDKADACELCAGTDRCQMRSFDSQMS
jgi:hypothetical protein